jgi:hypothetical protein
MAMEGDRKQRSGRVVGARRHLHIDHGRAPRDG